MRRLRISSRAGVFVLVERAGFDLAHPFRLGAARLRTVPGMDVRLALIAGRRVLVLAAPRQAERDYTKQDGTECVSTQHGGAPEQAGRGPRPGGTGAASSASPPTNRAAAAGSAAP